jgi:hypothetical protein
LKTGSHLTRVKRTSAPVQLKHTKFQICVSSNSVKLGTVRQKHITCMFYSLCNFLAN